MIRQKWWHGLAPNVPFSRYPNNHGVLCKVLLFIFDFGGVFSHYKPTMCFSSRTVEELAPPDCLGVEKPWTYSCDKLFW
jgi:hypothetical protein